MEATGVYWKPVWNILSDGAFELIVANAAHIKKLHGRLTDHHRFMLELYLGQHDALSQAIAKIDDAVDAATARMDEEVEAGQASFRSLILLRNWLGQSPWLRRCGVP